MAHLEGAVLRAAHLEGAVFYKAHLEGKTFAEHDPDLVRIRQWAGLFPATLTPADLRGAFLDDTTALNDAVLFDAAKTRAVTVADLHWHGANLAVVELPPASLLGDEWTARRPHDDNGRRKDRDIRRAEFQAAVRANRQLAVALEGQGLNEDGGHFAYNAQLLQQQVLWRQGRYGSWMLSRLLDGLAGYGYRPGRSITAYLVTIGLFALGYWWLMATGHTAEQLKSWTDPLVLSVTSFHGRAFFAGNLDLPDWVARVGAVEAILGLLLEIIFIATFTQRFFGTK
jgi:hypothetical protein